MFVNTKEKNPALESLFKNPNQVFFLDANVLIPPDRTKLGAKGAVSFTAYKREFLEPLFECFSGLGIHKFYYLFRTGRYNAKGLKALYKYMYRLTKKEDAENPEWGEFVQQMNALYANC